MHENQDVTSFMSSVYCILHELRDIGHAQSETVAVHKILNRLPSHFSNFLQMIQNERQIPSLYELASQLQMEETNSKLRQTISDKVLIMRVRNAFWRNHGDSGTTMDDREVTTPIQAHSTTSCTTTEEWQTQDEHHSPPLSKDC
jgi:hypothetical protein